VIVTRDYPTVDGNRTPRRSISRTSRSTAEALIGEEGGRAAADRQGDRRGHRRSRGRGLWGDAQAARGHAGLCPPAQAVRHGNRQFQVLQHRMVDMFIEVEQAVSMTYMATIKLDEADEVRARPFRAAKVQIGKACRFVGQNAIQIHGGMGMTDETGHRPLLQARHDHRRPVRLGRPSPEALRIAVVRPGRLKPSTDARSKTRSRSQQLVAGGFSRSASIAALSRRRSWFFSRHSFAASRGLPLSRWGGCEAPGPRPEDLQF
jgi:hypothetical protein